VTICTTDGVKSRLDGENVTTIFIFGYCGWKNTGEDAMIYGLLRELHTLYPTAAFAILAQTAITVPQETKNFVKFVRPAPQIIFREIKHSSIFIMSGGTHISDYGDRIVRLKIMSAIFIMLIWAKLFCKRIYLISIGVGPLSTIWGRLLSKQIHRLADFISVRDKLSYDILEGMGLKNKVTSSFDLAALLQPLSTDDNPLVKKDLLFVHEIAKGLNQWLKRDSQSLIYLFVFKDKLKYSDVLFTELLQKQLEPSERVKLIPYNPDPVLTLSQVAQCHAFVGMRYHSSVFAYLTNTPLLIINYFQKCQAFAEDVGLAKHTVVSLEEILNGEFEKYLKNLQENPDDFVATLPVDIAKQKAKNSLPTCINLEIRDESTKRAAK
jgi:polysaccharide pyruvyl transferase WcaK-like protein